MNDDEGWEVLSGCNACINSHLCYHLGNCALLNADILYPENNKTKRNFIRKLRSGITRPDLYAQEMKMMLPENWEEPEITPKMWSDDYEGKYKQTSVIQRGCGVSEKTYRTWNGSVRLTKLEQMFINELNKPR